MNLTRLIPSKGIFSNYLCIILDEMELQRIWSIKKDFVYYGTHSFYYTI